MGFRNLRTVDHFPNDDYRWRAAKRHCLSTTNTDVIWENAVIYSRFQSLQSHLILSSPSHPCDTDIDSHGVYASVNFLWLSRVCTSNDTSWCSMFLVRHLKDKKRENPDRGTSKNHSTNLQGLKRWFKCFFFHVFWSSVVQCLLKWFKWFFGTASWHILCCRTWRVVLLHVLQDFMMFSIWIKDTLTGNYSQISRIQL